MQRTLMAICLLVALALPRLVHGRPAIDDDRSVSNTLTARASKLEDLADYEQKATSSYAHRPPIPTELRLRRSSDHRLSELGTLMTISKINSKRSPLTTTGQRSRQLDPARIGRRRRSDEALVKPLPVHRRHRPDESRRNGNPAYSLIS